MQWKQGQVAGKGPGMPSGHAWDQEGWGTDGTELGEGCKNNQKGAYRCTGQKWQTWESALPLINEEGELALTNMEKRKVLYECFAVWILLEIFFHLAPALYQLERAQRATRSYLIKEWPTCRKGSKDPPPKHGQVYNRDFTLGFLLMNHHRRPESGSAHPLKSQPSTLVSSIYPLISMMTNLMTYSSCLPHCFKYPGGKEHKCMLATCLISGQTEGTRRRDGSEQRRTVASHRGKEWGGKQVKKANRIKQRCTRYESLLNTKLEHKYLELNIAY